MGRPIRSKGLAWIEVVVVLAIALGVVALLMPGYRRERMLSLRIGCAERLSSIGKAMLSYADDYDGALPRAGGRGTTWGHGPVRWSASGRSEAFGLDPNGPGGEATISASLYLLIRSGGVGPDKFICTQDSGIREFKPGKYGVRDRELRDLWDFGPNPAGHCSYSYHAPYSPYALTTANEPSSAVAADRNPWIESPSRRAENFSMFKPDVPSYGGTSEQAKHGNTVVHARDGQNVLFLDSHVEFAKRAYCSIEDDNIYTLSTNPTAGDFLGTPPTLGSQPANKKDSLLVNDPPAP